MRKLIMAFTGGCFTAIALFAAFVFWVVKQDPFAPLKSKSSESVVAGLTVQISRPIDVREFGGMSPVMILERFQFLDEIHRSAWQSIFESSILTEVQFAFDVDDAHHSQSFFIKSGKVKNHFFSTISRSSVEVISKSPQFRFEIKGFGEPSTTQPMD